MKNVIDDFKIDIRTYGRQLDIKFKVNNEDFDTDNLNYIKPSFNTNLFKTVMHQVEIDSKVFMEKDTKINFEIGIKVNEPSYNYINFNTYYVETCERQEDTNSYRIMAYTRIKESMVAYDLNIAEKITLREYLIRIFQRLSWDTSNIPATFINSNKLVSPILHTGVGYTFRDALDEITTISCSFIMFDGDIPILLYLNNTNEIIDESYLDEDNITIGEKYIINSLVFSRAEESDNIYRKDDNSISQYGLHEFKIIDNQLLSTNDRDLYIDEMFNYLKDLKFYIFDIQSKGILFLEACDTFKLNLNEIEYSTILLNNEISIEDGLTEKLYIDKPGETETDYKYADTTDKRIKQAYILVDKQNQTITQVVSKVDGQNSKISQVEQTVGTWRSSIENITNKQAQQNTQMSEILQEVNKISSKVENLGDLTNTIESRNIIHLTECVEGVGYIINFRIKGSTTNMAFLYPSDDLYPGDDVFPVIDRLILEVANNPEFNNSIFADLNITEPLRNTADVYDEFRVENNTAKIIRRLGYNENTGEIYALSQDEVTELGDFIIPTYDGNTYIRLYGFDNIEYMCKYLVKSDYNEYYATKGEFKTVIEQTERSLALQVDQKLSGYSTTAEMNTSINLTADSIINSVNYRFKNYDTTEQVNSKIEQKAGSITSTVSSQITTAKNEAINSSNASTDNKLQNYSTTTQMNSAITQKANEITSSINTTITNKFKDYSTTTQMNSAIEQKANSIISTVSSTYETKTNANTTKTSLQSQITQTASSITAEITNRQNADNALSTRIIANANGLESKVSKGSIISTINQSAESVIISASKVNLSGYLTITSASNTYATKSGLSGGTTTINGGCITTGTLSASKITTGTLDASKVSVTNLNASNITTGTLSANKISGGTLNLTGTNTSITSNNFAVDKNGNMTAKGGTIGGWLINENFFQKIIGNYSFEIRSDRPSNEPNLLVWDTVNNRYNFYVRPDGYFYARNGQISGSMVSGTISGVTISGSTINGGTISGSNINALAVGADTIGLNKAQGHYTVGNYVGKTHTYVIGGVEFKFVGGILVN